MITKRGLEARGKQINSKKEITPSYKNDPIAQEINKIYNSYPSLTSPTKADQDRINDLRQRMYARDSMLIQEYNATNHQLPPPQPELNDTEKQAERIVKFTNLINPKNKARGVILPKGGEEL